MFYCKRLRLLSFIFFVLMQHCILAQSLGSLNQRFEYVGISSTEFKRVAMYGTQRNMNWCWAACIQMVLNFNGVFVSQEEIVRKSLGSIIDKPADAEIMFRGLNGWRPGVNGKFKNISSNNSTTDLTEISAFLVSQRPLIVGLNQNGKVGHAYVLIGMHYEILLTKEGNKIYRPHDVILIDPWPQSSVIKDMSWSEFKNRIMVSYKVWVN